LVVGSASGAWIETRRRRPMENAETTGQAPAGSPVAAGIVAAPPAKKLQNFVVKVSRKDAPDGKDHAFKIVAPDHARATEWALLQLKHWGCSGAKFEVLDEEPPKPKEEKKAEEPKKPEARHDKVRRGRGK